MTADAPGKPVVRTRSGYYATSELARGKQSAGATPSSGADTGRASDSAHP